MSKSYWCKVTRGVSIKFIYDNAQKQLWKNEAFKKSKQTGQRRTFDIRLNCISKTLRNYRSRLIIKFQTKETYRKMFGEIIKKG